MKTYALHGLRICSQMPLDAPEIDSGDPDVNIVIGSTRPVGNEVPSGTLISHIDEDPPSNGYEPNSTLRRLVSVVENRDGYSMTYHGLAQLFISRDLRDVTVVLEPGSAQDVVSTIVGAGLGGMLVTVAGAFSNSTLPLLSGQTTQPAISGDVALHASAVCIGRRAIAFAGCSGSGKSTLAAMACASTDSVTLLTDDTLRVHVEEPRAWCYPGSSSVRLRPATTGLAGRFGQHNLRQTGDGRTAVELGRNDTKIDTKADPLAAIPLISVILPGYKPEASGFQLDKLPATEALIALLGMGRLANPTDPSIVSTHFAACASLVRSIPVYSVALADNYWASEASSGELIRAITQELLLETVGS